MTDAYDMLADMARDPIRLPENLVYVRPVAVVDLPDEVQEQAEGLSQLFAVHNPAGEMLALVKDRKLAFIVARQHEMMPVSVH